MRETVIHNVKQEKIIAIVRGVDAEKCISVADALYDGGIRLMEVTFQQSEPASFQSTADVILQLNKRFGSKMMFGAGTVTTPDLAELAFHAGAKFIISPDTNLAVISKTRELGMVSMPGAMTPTEVLAAHNAGADFVKLFPAGELGTSYVKAIRAPISHVDLLAVGGINENNIADFLRVGMCGAGVGGNLVNKKWIDNGDFGKITQTALSLVQAVRSI